MASDSGRLGDLYILHILVSPWPLRRYNLTYWIKYKINNIKSYLVGEARATILPPISFLGSTENMAAALSSWATTWFVMTTATPNYNTIWTIVNNVFSYNTCLVN